jgi:putative ATP-binding cassette transporter
LLDAHFGPAWRKAFLGLSAASTFPTAEAFFRHLLGGSKLFNHTWALIGRAGYLEGLHAFVESGQHRVAVFLGRGGIGKTKLLHSFSQGFECRHPTTKLFFLAEGLPVNVFKLLLGSSRWTAILALVAGLVGGAAGVGLIALIQFALGVQDVPVGRLVAAFAGLCLAVLVTRAASQTLLIRLAQNSVFRLYTRLSRAMLAVPLRQFELIGAHRLLAALTEDVPAIAGALVGVPIVLVNVAIVLCCLVYLGWLSLPLLFAVLGFLVLGVLAYEVLVLQALGQLHLARREHDALMKHFRGLTEGVKELQMHRGRREEFLERSLGGTAADLRDRTTAGMSLYAIAGTWGQLLFFVCIGVLLFAVSDRESVDRDVVSGYVLTILYAAAPVETIMTWLPILGRGRVALRAVEQLNLSLIARTNVTEDEALALPVTWFEHLELADVSHSYGHADDVEDGFVLGPLDLTLRRGELVFVVGGNGSGETTLAKLLVGLYAPAVGAVRLNGMPVADASRQHYRELFSAVFADGYLFDHFADGGDAQTDARARRYLRRLGLEQKLHIEGGRLSTTDLSQGQRKRLALLSAYLEDRPVYVFDEWACDQDPHFRKVFYTRLLPEFKARGKAVLVITHDDRYFHVADRIVKLDYGRLEEVTRKHDPVFRHSRATSVRGEAGP